MTYRASLGTRGELRRIAAEAETATIDRVRPWHRKTQPCQLAPHVVVPQWFRSELPVRARTPPPVVSRARAVAVETVDALVEAACAPQLEKAFRRGRRRRGKGREEEEEEEEDDDDAEGRNANMDVEEEGIISGVEEACDEIQANSEATT